MNRGDDEALFEYEGHAIVPIMFFLFLIAIVGAIVVVKVWGCH